VELGEELLPAQERQCAKAQDEDQGDDGAGEQAPADSPRAALPEVEDSDEAQEEQENPCTESGQDDQLDVRHVADFSVLEQLVPTAVHQVAKVPGA
jgi:hypothetical protein